MSDFLRHLLQRDRATAAREAARPRLPSRFETAGPRAGQDGLTVREATLEDRQVVEEGAATFFSSDPLQAPGSSAPRPPPPRRAPDELLRASDGLPSSPASTGPGTPPPRADRRGADAGREGSSGTPVHESYPDRPSLEPGSPQVLEPAADRRTSVPAATESRSDVRSQRTPPRYDDPPASLDRDGSGERAPRESLLPPAPMVREGADPLRGGRPAASAMGREAPPDGPDVRPGSAPQGRRSRSSGAASSPAPAIRPRESMTAGVMEVPAGEREVEEPGPIQIRIGRVEVRAAPDLSRPRAPTPPPRRPSLSLDEYLKRRNEGRP
jgi:hypothetical protein